MSNFIQYDNNGVIYSCSFSSEGMAPSSRDLNVMEVPHWIDENKHYVLNGEVAELPVDLWQLYIESTEC